VVGASGTVTSQNITAIGKPPRTASPPASAIRRRSTAPRTRPSSRFRAANKTDPDLYGADSYGLLFAYKAAVEKAGSTETDKVREALRGLSWQTPQGTKTIRAGDHQAMQPMYAVRVTKGKFDIIDNVSSENAIGPDACTRF
jgi:branched-chain amino acid transport system substrate-binding protein